jgi:hypothetical protein
MSTAGRNRVAEQRARVETTASRSKATRLDRDRLDDLVEDAITRALTAIRADSAETSTTNP